MNFSLQVNKSCEEAALLGGMSEWQQEHCLPEDGQAVARREVAAWLDARRKILVIFLPLSALGRF